MGVERRRRSLDDPEQAGGARPGCARAAGSSAGAAGRRHVNGGLPAGDAEPFWPAQLTAAAALVLYLTLPHALIMGPKWLVPGVEGVLLLGLVITTPTRHHNQSARLRALIVGLVGLVSLTTLISLILLARFLLDGSHAGGHALLFAGAVLWLTNVLIFGIWYWELDRGGPGTPPRPERRDQGTRLPVPTDDPAATRARLATRVRRLPLHVVYERDRVQPHRHDAAQRDGEAADGDRSR